MGIVICFYFVVFFFNWNIDFCLGDPQDLTTPVIMYDYESGKLVNEELIRLLTFEMSTPKLNKVSENLCLW